MRRDYLDRPVVVWIALASLTLLSVMLAERTHLHTVAIVAMFVIAAIKGELVISRYMEIGGALRHWRIAYRLWLVGVTLLLTVGHLVG